MLNVIIYITQLIMEKKKNKMKISGQLVKNKNDYKNFHKKLDL